MEEKNALEKGGHQHHHARNSTQMPEGWDKHRDDQGNRYYSNNETQVSQWTAPEGSTGGGQTQSNFVNYDASTMMPEEEKNQREQLWCYDTKSSWTLREYTNVTTEKDRKTSKELLIITLSGTDEGTQVKVLKENTRKYNTSHALDYHDVTRMDDMSEGPLMHLLRRRYEQQNIYTNAGNVLISVNPYENIPGLYDMPPS